MLGGVLVLLVVTGIAMLIYSDWKKRRAARALPPDMDVTGLLEGHVAFYRALSAEQKLQFETRVKDFLDNVTIKGVDVQVENLDRVLIAAGAITLIFSFPDWKYNNISEVLLYKGTFNREFSTDKGERNVLGMVGDGAMHREMILSQPSLRASFANEKDGHNTVLHEFAHLIDKADGAVDGAPDYLLPTASVQPWMDRMHETIQEMKSKRKTDINMYGATNDAEFFAVITEYFFERPTALKEHHPELYDMLEQMFHPELVTA